MKYNTAYRRFRHFGKDKVTMDFAFFAIAFNLAKMWSIMAKHAKNGGNTPFFALFFAYIRFFLGYETPFWEKFAKNRRLIDYRNRGRKKGGCAVKANYDTPPKSFGGRCREDRPCRGVCLS